MKFAARFLAPGHRYMEPIPSLGDRDGLFFNRSEYIRRSTQGCGRCRNGTLGILSFGSAARIDRGYGSICSTGDTFTGDRENSYHVNSYRKRNLYRRKVLREQPFGYNAAHWRPSCNGYVRTEAMVA